MFNKQTAKTLLVGFALILALNFSASAQTKRQTSNKKPTTKKNVPAKVETLEIEIQQPTTIKKNARPETETPAVPTEKPNKKPDETVKSDARPTSAENRPVYFYEFSKPEFTVSKINVEHDENGKGKITFQKKDFAESVTDPLQLSARALERLKTAWQTLNFLDSTENYQTVKDFSHLGTMKFSMNKDGRTRSAAFNWTDNETAKTLADEYRRIGQQLVWIFDINVARENQPLDAPRLLDALDALVRRGEVSDAPQMIPFLKGLGNDERIPLIARNRATKLIEKIEKSEAKKTNE